MNYCARRVVMTSTNGTRPQLPREVWNPILTLFRDWMIPATEAPEEYIFASAFTTIGLAIGRDVYVHNVAFTSTVS